MLRTLVRRTVGKAWWRGAENNLLSDADATSDARGRIVGGDMVVAC